MKKSKLLLLLILLVSVFGISKVDAAKSNYYKYVWTNDVDQSSEYIGFVTNDIIKVKDGYLAAGFKNPYAYIRLLNNDGSLKKTISFKDSIYARLKMIFATDGGYVAIGVEGGHYVAITLNSKYSHVDTVWTDESYSNVDFSEIGRAHV